ncbi:hypothetical protein KQX54_003379 [Cotesia glomerata]|uniref:SET domain-containing protein n=1 Tax=Cotesia glomerata TaxID=32391 RepID=A0AAV7ILJ0_COTGL|nr:hypothetical protein KQX54_003379 [Cotesia glomerata]
MILVSIKTTISIIVIIFVTKILGNIENYSTNEFHTAQIIIFYSPLNSELIRGQIVIYWHVPKLIEGDTLNLYYGHPDLNEIMPIYSYEPENKSGVVKTGIPPRYALYDTARSLLFWGPIIQERGNANSPEKLKIFTDDYENYSKNAAKSWDDDPLNFRAMMAAVTLDMTSIVTDSVAHFFGQESNSSREVGTQVGPLITVWYNENDCTLANIVAVDFIDATGIVPVAIYWNKIREEQNYAKKINSSNI